VPTVALTVEESETEEVRRLEVNVLWRELTDCRRVVNTVSSA
jgi:hypothetical protein